MSLPAFDLARAAGHSLGPLPGLLNRHGLVAGATGTGKTVTLQSMAEQMSRLGIPVFLADVKGDLSGIGLPGGGNRRVDERRAELGIHAPFAGCPVSFWDVFGQQGHPLRTTISDMGPLLLARLLELNDTQEGVLTVAFRVADDEGLPLLNLDDLRAMLAFVHEQRASLSARYGNVAPTSVGAIQRRLLTLEDQGAAGFFGEPMLDIKHLMDVDGAGHGRVNVLAADRLMNAPRLYAMVLLWLLSELFENLPEAGDPEKPRLVFFFDEAHLLFDGAPQVLVDKVERVVRLIRSKGVGIFFVTQNPLDVPDSVLGQLGNRVQHALRAFTPRDQKAVRAAAQTFRANPDLDVEAAITELGVGEALVSFLETKGTPGVVQRALIVPPASRLGPASEAERRELMSRPNPGSQYDRTFDRDSAFEMLQRRAEAGSAAHQAPPTPRGRGGGGDDMWTALAKSAARSVGSQLGRQIVRGILGTLLGGKR